MLNEPSSPRKSPKGQLFTSLVMPKSPSPKNQLPSIAQMENSKTRPEVPVLQSSNSNEELLAGALKSSEKITSFAERQMIDQRKTLIETRVHDIQSGQPESITLENIYKLSVPNPYVEKGIEQVMSRAHQKAAGSLQVKKMKPTRNIPLTKDDLRELEKVDKYRLLKIKNGQIKHKIVDLREQMQREYYEKKANYRLPQFENIKESDYYSIDNPKTQEANHFVHKLQSQRNQQRRMYKQYLERKREEDERNKQIELQKRRSQAEERRRLLQQKIQQKQERKRQQEAENAKKKQQYLSWSKIFNQQKPLYVKKQQQFIQNQLIPQIYNRREKLLQIKLERRPIDIKEIHEHDERYMEYKRDDAIRMEAQMELQKEKIKNNEQEQQRYYKGMYRYLALEQISQEKAKLTQDPHQSERQKRLRQILYGNQLNEQLQQKMKQKHIQMQTLSLEKKQFTKRKRNIDGSVSVQNNTVKSTPDPKVDGKKNLYFMKQLIREKGIKKDKPIIRLVEQRHVYPDYLHQATPPLRKHAVSLHNSLLLDQPVEPSLNTINALVATERKMEQKARRDHMRRKHGSIYYEEDPAIEENEINAARLKMKMVNQLD